MFFGTTPQIVSQYIFKEICRLKPKRVIVPFSGNFVIEQLAGKYSKDCETLCTDISLYSRAIGYGAVNKSFHCILKENILEMFPYFRNKIAPRDIAAQVIFFTEIAANLKKDGVPYYHSLNNYAKCNTETLMNKIYKQFDDFCSQLSNNFNFYGVDAFEFLNNAEEGDFVFFDPPVIMGDYEKMFSPLENCFEFTTPKYTEFNNNIIYDKLNELAKLGCNVYYRTNEQIDLSELNNYIQCYNYQYKWHASYCLYTNINTNIFVNRFSPLNEEIKNYKIISKDFIFTENTEIRLLQVKKSVANHYRMLWVNKAEMSDGGIPFLIFADNVVIGMIQISEGVKMSTTKAAIFSDPAAPTSKYKRLSKLILNIICTETFLKYFNQLTIWGHDGFTTRVFTNDFVSMKYRNLFELVKRENDNDSNYKFKLIYHNKKLFKDYKEALIDWLKKDALHLNN